MMESGIQPWEDVKRKLEKSSLYNNLKVGSNKHRKQKKNIEAQKKPKLNLKLSLKFAFSTLSFVVDRVVYNLDLHSAITLYLEY